MLGTRLKITAYERRHRSALLDVAFCSQWTHKHLDWHETSRWLDKELGHVLLAWSGDQLVGYIGISLATDGWSWICLLGIRDGRMPGLVLRELCETAEALCLGQGVRCIVVLMVTNWLQTYLRDQGFRHDEDIITMRRVERRLPPEPRIPARLRSAEAPDFEHIMNIDRLAFEAPWRLTEADLWQAFRIAASVTVAMVDDQLAGYQLSTRQDRVGHLARLAVHPSYRRRRVGSALLHRLLVDSGKWNLTDLSLNTQLGNRASQRLYERFGFFRNGFDIELWRKQLN